MPEINQVLTCLLTRDENPKGPFEKFHAEGKILESHPSIYIHINDTNTSSFIVNGNIRANKITTTRNANYSDMRLKENIEDFTDGLDLLCKLCPKKFNYINQLDTCYGFLAQDVETIIPEIVDQDKDNYKQVYYNELIPIMCNAIKELKLLVDELRNKK